METEWNKLSILIISVLATAGMAISFFVNYPIAGTVLGVTIGFVLSYIVQTKTQRRAWKRDFIIKTVDSVYGPLYDESILIETRYDLLSSTRHYYQFIINTWKAIKNNYTYHLIEDSNFRKDVESFYDLIDECNLLISYTYEKVGKIISSRGSEFYKMDVIGLGYFFKIPTGREEPILSDCLIHGIHPTDAYTKSSQRWEIQVTYRSDSSGQTSKMLNSDKDFEEFETLWKIMLKDVNEDQKIQKMKIEYEKVQAQNIKLRAKLVERIQRQWKV